MAKKEPAPEGGPDVVAPPPLLFLAPLAAGLALDRLFPLPPLPRAVRPAGLPLLGAGVGLLGWFFSTMVRAGTPIDVREVPTTLVETGPFKFTRNPAYLGMALTYTGINLLAGGRWPLLCCRAHC
jgi:protein-S-isoprenylcysteine O-methyltransferase Ste14